MNSKLAAVAIVGLILLASLVAGLQAVDVVEAGSEVITVPIDYPTIQAAIDNAPEGAMVFVKSGTYSNLNLTINKSIALTGENPQTTILQGQKPLLIEPQTSPSKSHMQSTAQSVTQLATQTSSKQAIFCNFVPPYPQTSITIVVNAPNVNISGFTINGADICIQVNSYNAHIVGNNLAANDYAVYLSGHSNRVENNTITGNKAVFSVGASNTIIGNFISSYVGVELYSNSNLISKNIFQTGNAITISSAWGYSGGLHVISKNNITGNKNGLGISLGVITPNNLVFENNITSCDVAILLAYSSYNSFYANTISNCNMAIVLAGEASVDPELPYSPKNNTFYHNNFINNTLNIDARDDKFLETSNSTKNFWDNGKEGNYWNNYNGTDTNSDGISDVPYVIDAKRQDNFPLMLPFDVKNNTIQFPIALPSPTLTPMLSPIMTPTGTPTQQPTLEPTQTDSSINAKKGYYGVDYTSRLIVIVLVAVAVVVGLLVYFKKRKEKQ